MSSPARLPEYYPESDGKRMAENTLQFDWIVTIKCGLDAVFQNDQQVFVAGDLLWYPVFGDPLINVAPDVLVAFGRPKGHRGSYKQWEEQHVAPQVVFEVLSPSNDWIEMRKKLDFYDTYGVEEYYLFDPYRPELRGWQRRSTAFLRIPNVVGYTSPRLGVRFELDKDLVIVGPDGRPFVSFVELHEQRRREAERADQERQRADQAEARAEQFRALLREKGISIDEPPQG